MKLHKSRCALKVVSRSSRQESKKIWAKWKKSIIDYEDRSKRPASDLWIPPKKEDRKDDRPRIEIINDGINVERGRDKEKEKPERGICIISSDVPDPCVVDHAVDFTV